MSAFHLVQRLRRRDNEARKGFDAMFECDYMGAAEFEWGALPESLKRIRSARRLAVNEGAVTRGDITLPVFVVGNAKTINEIPAQLTAWMVDEYPRGKEMTYFPEKVTGAAKEWHRVDAWWSLTDDVMWALDESIAHDLLTAVKS